MIYFIGNQTLLPEEDTAPSTQPTKLTDPVINNTFDSTKKCLETIHKIVCPLCTKTLPYCQTCTRIVGYEDVLKGLNKKPWPES